MRTINPGRIRRLKMDIAIREHPPRIQSEVDKFLSGKTKLHDLAGELFSMKGTPQVAFGEIKYDPHTREVSTPESASLDYKVGYDSLARLFENFGRHGKYRQKHGKHCFWHFGSPPANCGGDCAGQ